MIADRQARRSAMALLRMRLHRYHRRLKWLRRVAQWQMRWLPAKELTRKRFAAWINLLTLDEGEQVFWRFPGTQLRFLLDLDDALQSEMYYSAGYQQQIIEIARRFLRPDAVFVDMGANIGQHALLVAERYRRQGRDPLPWVIAFEADPSIYARLDQNIRLNGLSDYVSAHNAAVWDQEGTASLYRADKSNSGSGSLARHNPGTYHGQTGEATQVPTISLDSVVARLGGRLPVGLIKADIEGAELMALRGAKGVLAKDRPALILEAYGEWMEGFGYTYNDLRSFLKGFDYSIFVIRPDGGLIADSDEISPDDFTDILCLPTGVG